MTKQVPSKASRGVHKAPSDPFHDEFYGEHMYETNTDWLNKHAEDYEVPSGRLHLHLTYAHTVHWRAVTKGSHVCKIPGPCHIVWVLPELIPMLEPEEKHEPGAGVQSARVQA